jgi:hypothetical protein
VAWAKYNGRGKPKDIFNDPVVATETEDKYQARVARVCGNNFSINNLQCCCCIHALPSPPFSSALAATFFSKNLFFTFFSAPLPHFVVALFCSIVMAVWIM